MQASRPLASEVAPVGGGQWSHLTSSARRANISLPASQFARPPRASRSAKPPSTKPSKPRRRTQSPSVPGPFALDRKSVVSGKSVSVRVDLGGRRILKKKKKNNKL